MTSIKVKFRASTIPKREGVIYFQLIHNRKVRLITTRFRLLPNEWDTKKESVKCNTTDPKRQKELQQIKKAIDIELKALEELIVTLSKLSHYTVDDLMQHYSNHSLTGSLKAFMEHQIRKMQQNNQSKTASIYATVLRSFLKFRRGHDLKIEKMDSDLMTRYETYLKENNICLNTISCYMRVLRAVYNKAVDMGLAIQKQPFKNVYTGVDKTVKRAVNEDIIVRLKTLDLDTQSELRIARDLFLFSFYTRGMSFVDMANLKCGNIEHGFLRYTRSKTGQNLTIKVESCIELIISRYQHLTVGDYLLPICTAQSQNYARQLRTYNNRLGRISTLLQLPKPLSSYVARHSWATLALRKGISVQIISESMGHENESTTRIYLASLDQSTIDEANARIISL